ncbi:lysozyme-like isoform X2 [Macrobrachium rosenbergii]|uniref:lysozyme-like isoform X2 n=1 Tax=Macrobrachium rosenbergii TaxID=79674 RepID=UPI0034D63402
MKTTSTIAQRSLPGQPWSCLLWIFVAHVIVGSQVSWNASGIPRADADGNMNIGCTKPYYGGYRCGPLSISWHYWADAESPKMDGDENLKSEIAFEKCVEDYFCAVRTVLNYINKFKGRAKADCNSDGKVNCFDYIQMHIAGGYNCSQAKIHTDPRYARFHECYGRKE